MKKNSIAILTLAFLLNSCGGSSSDDKTITYKTTEKTSSSPYANVVGVSQNNKSNIKINNIPFYDALNDIKILHNRYAYVADGYAGISVIDTQNYTIISNYDTDGYTHAVEIQGNLLYVADGAEGVKILNIKDPYHPYLINSIQTYNALDIAIRDSVLFVADKLELKIIDASNPHHLMQITSYEKNVDILKVDIVGNRAFIGDFYGHTKTLDILDPRKPKLLN
jgi:hypothetical protein